MDVLAKISNFYNGIETRRTLSPFSPLSLLMERLHLSFQKNHKLGWSDGNISPLIHILKELFFMARALILTRTKVNNGINVGTCSGHPSELAKFRMSRLVSPFYNLGTRVGGSRHGFKHGKLS
ncbi:hypothetical protein Tco_1419742 [Tanacetum coccineum]|uniref:Uncharacterized protein n=1 Tax=Tanacetum coccineum TaxID=301880 RepID=A0ABQ4ZIQ2_9ASTR